MLLCVVLLALWPMHTGAWAVAWDREHICCRVLVSFRTPIIQCLAAIWVSKSIQDMRFAHNSPLPAVRHKPKCDTTEFSLSLLKSTDMKTN